MFPVATQRLGPGFRAVHWTVPIALGVFETPSRTGDDDSEDAVVNVLFEGAYRVRGSHGRGVADANRWVFLDRGASYRNEPVAGRVWRGSYLRFHPGLARELLTTLAPDRPAERFPCTTGPIDPAHLRRWHELLHRPGDPAAVEEDLLLLGGDILASALPRSPGEPDPARRAQVLAVQEQLCAAPARNEALAELGARVELSAFQLARAFRAHLGTSVHQYRDALRLNLAAARLADRPDLTNLALELGFASHSHFSARFRRRFGCAPSRFSSAIPTVPART